MIDTIQPSFAVTTQLPTFVGQLGAQKLDISSFSFFYQRCPVFSLKLQFLQAFR
jgi:hypothetical protein